MNTQDKKQQLDEIYKLQREVSSLRTSLIDFYENKTNKAYDIVSQLLNPIYEELEAQKELINGDKLDKATFDWFVKIGFIKALHFIHKKEKEKQMYVNDMDWMQLRKEFEAYMENQCS